MPSLYWRLMRRNQKLGSSRCSGCVQNVHSRLEINHNLMPTIMQMSGVEFIKTSRLSQPFHSSLNQSHAAQQLQKHKPLACQALLTDAKPRRRDGLFGHTPKTDHVFDGQSGSLIPSRPKLLSPPTCAALRVELPAPASRAPSALRPCLGLLPALRFHVFLLTTPYLHTHFLPSHLEDHNVNAEEKAGR